MHKKLMIVTFIHQKRTMEKLLGQDWIVMTPGEAVIGHHFTDIVVACNLPELTDRGRVWVDEVIDTRKVSNDVKALYL